ncbi:MAG TPA: hypothetical protein VL175_18005, partial [Pirellulales bacterium]|nr:hypothetical protein [Pirellulales bacterium]
MRGILTTDRSVRNHACTSMILAVGAVAAMVITRPLFGKDDVTLPDPSTRGVLCLSAGAPTEGPPDTELTLLVR